MSKDEIWVCNDGRELLVADMDEAHVRSCLRMVIRNMNENNLHNIIAPHFLRPVGADRKSNDNIGVFFE